jgi:hypothetical protein
VSFSQNLSRSSSVTSVIVWMPVAPVPITATRLPAKLTGSFGQ